MKLKYVDYYEKGVSRVVNGVPVIVDGKVVRDVKPMYLYAVVDATPEEISNLAPGSVLKYREMSTDGAGGEELVNDYDIGTVEIISSGKNNT